MKQFFFITIGAEEGGGGGGGGGGRGETDAVFEMTNGIQYFTLSTLRILCTQGHYCRTHRKLNKISVMSLNLGHWPKLNSCFGIALENIVNLFTKNNSQPSN